jgi:hypothetical protein
LPRNTLSHYPLLDLHFLTVFLVFLSFFPFFTTLSERLSRHHEHLSTNSKAIEASLQSSQCPPLYCAAFLAQLLSLFSLCTDS